MHIPELWEIRNKIEKRIIQGRVNNMLDGEGNQVDEETFLLEIKANLEELIIILER